MLCIPIFGMLGVSRETTPFWNEIHTFVLTVYISGLRFGVVLLCCSGGSFFK